MSDRVPGSEKAVILATAAVTLSPMVTAFSTELGKRLGGSAADWLKKIRLRPRTRLRLYRCPLCLQMKEGSRPPMCHGIPMELVRGNPSVLEVKTDGRTTVFEVSDDMPDEAKLGLIDIDLTKPEIRGHRLRWDGSQWQATDKRSPKTSAG
jgi:hypothetical protein